MNKRLPAVRAREVVRVLRKIGFEFVRQKGDNMIAGSERDAILKCAKKYNVGEVVLFGGSLERDDTNDIDIGIKGIKPHLFFKFYGELLLNLAKNVDVVDLTEENSFNRLVEQEGVRLYG